MSWQNWNGNGPFNYHEQCPQKTKDMDEWIHDAVEEDRKMVDEGSSSRDIA